MDIRGIILFSIIGILMIIFPGSIRKAISGYASLILLFQVRAKSNQIQRNLTPDKPNIIRIIGICCLLVACAGLINRF
jgi:uncharacterized protein YjeT (DUF2065 family)